MEIQNNTLNDAILCQFVFTFYLILILILILILHFLGERKFPPPPSKTKKETPRVLFFMILPISHATECLTLKIEVGSNEIN